MSLFVLDTENPAQEILSSAEAFAAIILITTAPDGVLTDAEANCIYAILSRMQLFNSYSQDMIYKLFDKLLKVIQQNGINTLFNAAKDSLSLELREAAFALVSDLVLVKSNETEEEKNFLNDLYYALDISHDLAIQIVQVMLIKNRG
jgi:hypothetical protein